MFYAFPDTISIGSFTAASMEYFGFQPISRLAALSS
jgi:hypothetical protein